MPVTPLAAVSRGLRRLVSTEASDEALLQAFANRADEDAFAALVRRHGGLVMGVCRRALDNEQDAEDAFQATFLVLARSAAVVRRPGALAAWLHGVATRLARNARREQARRRTRDRVAARQESMPRDEDLSWREVRAILDEEVAELPEPQRDAFVLCYLQELSRPDAARKLGIKEGTLCSRLARAKAQLQARLTGRGVSPALALPALAEVTRSTLLPTLLGAAACLLLAVGLVVATTADKPAAAVAEKADPKSEVSGRVLDPDGKPVADATVSVHVTAPGEKGTTTTAKTDAEGRFRVSYKKSDHTTAVVVASAAGFGPAWETPGDKPVTLKLVKDRPVQGRVIDLEGRPVKGARVRLRWLEAPPEATLAEHFERASRGESRFVHANADALPEPLRVVTADDKGVLRLVGFGQERIAVVVIEGPGIASCDARVLTGKGTAPRGKFGSPAYSPDFQHLAAPSRPVVLTLRDRDTKKPIPGMLVDGRASQDAGVGYAETAGSTDAAGRLRILGLPKGRGNLLRLSPGPNVPYLGGAVEVPDLVGGDAVTVDVDLPRGVWAEGRVTDKATGQPVPLARVEYFAWAANPNVAHVPGVGRLSQESSSARTSTDGRFRVPVLPGKGVVAVQSREGFLLLADQAVQEIDVPITLPFRMLQSSFHGFAPVDPAADAVRVVCDVKLDAGETIKGKLVDADGKPVRGARPLGLSQSGNGWEGPLPTDEFRAGAVNRDKPRLIAFAHADRNLVGTLQLAKDHKGDVVVTLTKGSGITGRILDADGKPRKGVKVNVFWFREGTAYTHAKRTATDADGRFRLDGLFADLRYRVAYDEDGTSLGGHALKAGEVKDLGNVSPRRD